jgi:hypothetical protein
MTCKDAINSDEKQRKSVEEKRYPLSENRGYNKIFESDLQGTNDQNSKIKRYSKSNLKRQYYLRFFIMGI